MDLLLKNRGVPGGRDLKSVVRKNRLTRFLIRSSGAKIG